MTVQPIAFFYHWPCPLSFQNVESKKKNDGSLLPPPHGHADLTHSTSCWLLQTKWFWNRLYFFSRQLAVVPVYYTNILIVQTGVLPKKNEKMSLHWFLGPSETTWQNPFKGKISCFFFFFLLFIVTILWVLTIWVAAARQIGVREHPLLDRAAGVTVIAMSPRKWRGPRDINCCGNDR